MNFKKCNFQKNKMVKNYFNNKNIEQGSITLFTLISIIFFLIIGIGIYINVSNKEVSQVSEIEKIKSEYQINKEQMDEKYEEIMDNVNQKVVITLKKVSDNSDYVSGTWTNDSVKVKIEYPEGTIEDDKIIYVNGKKVPYKEEMIIEETSTIKVIFNGKEQNIQINIDKTMPTLTITANKQSPTNASSITYTFKFSEDVTEFTQDDILVTNGTKGAFSGSGKTYTLVVTNSGSTTQTVKVNANVCKDIAGNGNLESNKLTITIDKEAPTVIITADRKSPTNANSITYTFTFSENVTGFTADDVTVTNGTKGTFSGSGKTYTLVVTNTGSTTQNLKVDANKCTDTAGNGNIASSTFTMAIDKEKPTVTITADKKSPTNASSITYTFTFSEDVTGFTTDDILITNGTKSTFSGSGKTYTLVVTNSGSTTQTIKVDANKCTDTAGNGNTASSTFTITIDRTSPTVSISANQNSPTTATSITYTITFSESVTGFTQDDIQVTNGTKGAFNGSGNKYTLVVTQSSSTTQTVKINANVCTDTAGNGNSASNTLTIEINRRQTLTINPNGGKYNGTTSQTYISQDPNTKYTLSNPTPPSGYIVYFDGNGGTPRTGSINSTKSFSNWSHTSGAGSLSGNTYTFGTSGGTVTANYSNGSITLTSASRSGYIFQGWYDGIGNYIGTSGTIYTPTSNITLYAHWQLAVAQIGSTLYPSLASAINAVPANNVQTTVTLLVSTTETITVPANKNVRLNLNGKTLTGASSSDATLTNNGTTYVYGGTITKGSFTIYNNKTLTVASGTIGPAITYYAITNKGSLNITGGTIQNSVSYTVENTSSMSMSGGTISLTGTNNLTALMNLGTLSMTGGSVDSYAHGLVTRGTNAYSYVTNATITARNNIGIFSDEGGLANVYNSRINCTNAYVANQDKNGKLILYNCTWSTNTKMTMNDGIIAVFTDSTFYDVYCYGYSGTSRVTFPTWTAANNQDDITWGDGTKTTNTNNDVWYYRVYRSSHNNEGGTYYTHIYQEINGSLSLISDKVQVNY